jgi:DNA polymerase III epsilon subunit-like protein
MNSICFDTETTGLHPNGSDPDEIIGYNVGFDLGFLSAVGVRPREDARITDTMNEFTWFMGRRYKLVDAADHIGYEWTGRAHGSLADARATLAVQRWLEQWLVAE